MPSQQDSITCQIDRAVQPPGLIASASTYRLLLTHEGLYAIRLGRAMGPKVKSRDMLADALAGVMVNKIERKLEEHLRRVEDDELPGRSPEELLSRPKSFLVTPGSVKKVRAVVMADGGAVLWIKSSVKNLRLNCAAADREAVEMIVEFLSPG